MISQSLTSAAEQPDTCETVTSQTAQLANTTVAMSEMADRFEDLMDRINGGGSAVGEESSAPKPVLAIVPSLVASNSSLLTTIERLQSVFANIKSTLGV